MLVLQLNYGQRPVYDLCYPHGDIVLQNKISSIAKEYVRRIELACVTIDASVTVSDYFFEKPLRRFVPTTIFGKLSTCPASELRVTAVAVQRDIARAITRWEVDHGLGAALPQPQPEAGRWPRRGAPGAARAHRA